MRLLLLMLSLLLFACGQEPATSRQDDSSWQQALNKHLPLLGHRNWILVVDKAYPAQSAAGIEVVDTGKELPEVLAATLDQLKKEPHVAPVVYQDKELGVLSNDLFPGVDAFKSAIAKQVAGYPVQALLHDSVLARMAQTAERYKVLVLKTETAVPYSSVFLELDCRYWGPEKETLLRQKLATTAGAGQQ